MRCLTMPRLIQLFMQNGIARMQHRWGEDAYEKPYW